MISLQSHVRLNHYYFYFLFIYFLYPLDSVPYGESFSETITETSHSSGIGSD